MLAAAGLATAAALGLVIGSPEWLQREPAVQPAPHTLAEAGRDSTAATQAPPAPKTATIVSIPEAPAAGPVDDASQAVDSPAGGSHAVPPPARTTGGQAAGARKPEQRAREKGGGAPHREGRPRSGKKTQPSVRARPAPPRPTPVMAAAVPDGEDISPHDLEIITAIVRAGQK